MPSNPAITFSVPYTTNGVEEFLTQVRPFIEACELPDGMAYMNGINCIYLNYKRNDAELPDAQ